MSLVVTSTWAGRPSRIATREGPWDSPAVSQRNMRHILTETLHQPERVPATERSEEARARADPAQISARERSEPPRNLRRVGERAPTASAVESCDDRLTGHDAEPSPEQQERAERVGALEHRPVPLDDRDQQAGHGEEQERGVEADEQGDGAGVPQRAAEQGREPHVAKAHPGLPDEPQQPEDGADQQQADDTA